MQHDFDTNTVLPGITLENTYQQLPDRFYALVEPNHTKSPQLVMLNVPLAKQIGLDVEKLDRDLAARIFTGNVALNDGKLLAMNYSGHQFGQFNPQMGDGRAALIGEVIDLNGRRLDIQLKGSGRTPFSKMGDGKAALGPVMREYIVSEAMYALGIPTTRSLAIATTGEAIFREAALPGAVLTRVAASHIRIGTFQYFAARGDVEGLRVLADYAIDRHYPELRAHENPYLDLLSEVIRAQACLVAKWMSIGFIHGVMNTDNMTISGETIDYGPCAFMDFYEHDKVYSSIDLHGRYAYGAQPNIAQWNLARFAEAMLPLLDEEEERAVEKAKSAIEKYPDYFMGSWSEAMAPKFGLNTGEPDVESDRELMRGFLSLLQRHNADFTSTFRILNKAIKDDTARDDLASVFENDDVFSDWFELWIYRVGKNTAEAAKRMASANPLYIPRNHLVEEAIQAAESSGDFQPMEILLKYVSNPYVLVDGAEKYALPPSSEQEIHQTFCGT